MIIDQNLVSIDNKPLSAGAITGNVVGLSMFLKPGKVSPIPFHVGITEEAVGGTSITVKLQMCDTPDGSFTDAGVSVTVPLADMNKGGNICWRFLPSKIDKPYFRVVVTPAGTFTAGKVFAAVVSEDVQGYEPGMYVDGGKVKG